MVDIADYVREVLADKCVIGWPDWMPHAMQEAIYEECLYLADTMLDALGDGGPQDPLLLPHGTTQLRRSATNGPFGYTTLVELERRDTDSAFFSWRDWLTGNFRSIRSEQR